MLWLLAIPLLLQFASAYVPDAVLVVTEGYIAADCTPRWSTLINGTAPGPELRFQAGQHVWIRVYNQMESANTTVHWHGLSQRMAPFSDGTPLTSQWPIAPGDYFDYEFLLQPEDTGTYFYHSHVDLQATTAQGPFIVTEAQGKINPYSYQDERTLFMNDYYHANDSTIRFGLTNTSFAWLGEPQSLVVNGKTVGSCNSSKVPAGQSCETCSYEQIVVNPDTTYRFRMIGGTTLSYLSVLFEGHDSLTLIEADGRYLEAYNASHIEIATGQRYSFLFKTKSEAEVLAERQNATYWGVVETRWRPIKTADYFLLTYNISSATNISASSPAPKGLNATLALPAESFGWVLQNLETLKDAYDPVPSDDEVTRTILFNGQQLAVPYASTKTNGSEWVVNEVSYNETTPYRPTLVALYQDLVKPNYTLAAMNGGYDASTETYPVKQGEVVDLIIQNLAASSGVSEAHPFHQHGAHYYYLGGAPGEYSKEALAVVRQTQQPVIRDTNVAYPSPHPSYLGNEPSVALGTPEGWIAYRVRVNDPGAWLLHCHILPHMTMGMMTQLLFGAESLPTLPDNYRTAEYFDYGAPGQQPVEPMSYFKAIGMV